MPTTVEYTPRRWEGRPTDLPIFPDQPVEYRLHLDGGAVLDVFAHIRSNSKHLILAGQDALNRVRPPLPHFARWSWHRDLPVSFITFNDPALYLADNVLCGWSHYSYEFFGVEIIFGAFRRILDLTGTADEDTVLYGASAGGFWALLTGALIPEATVVVEIPQTSLITYPYQHHVQAMMAAVYPGHDREAIKLEMLHRFDVARYYEREGRHPHRIIYHQNSLDTLHVETQLQPFVAATRQLGIVEVRHYERLIARGPHCPMDKPESVAAMLEPLQQR